MGGYIHRVNYYETDKMGISHHSNYVRWMEEARMYFLKEIGYEMRRIEAEGYTSPVVSLECQYKETTTFDDEIMIEVSLIKYTGAVYALEYTMKNTENGDVVFTGVSSHCFIDEKGRPVSVRKRLPELDLLLKGIPADKKF